ncbi:hypothetical protein [Roseibium sp. RKSG952]|uniref:hypothetical protein n=1 Tax=Roseibium sp. RKSG952 TaxID=2529384 RepID=UPI0012BB7FD2|nr:hypothetical protein [Roseibium sp. RKSG952]MTI01119.1 hypothetical protein [Roseibium sp. RKSG952]
MARSQIDTQPAVRPTARIYQIHLTDFRIAALTQKHAQMDAHYLQELLYAAFDGTKSGNSKPRKSKRGKPSAK